MKRSLCRINKWFLPSLFLLIFYCPSTRQPRHSKGKVFDVVGDRRSDRKVVKGRVASGRPSTSVSDSLSSDAPTAVEISAVQVSAVQVSAIQANPFDAGPVVDGPVVVGPFEVSPIVDGAVAVGPIETSSASPSMTQINKPEGVPSNATPQNATPQFEELVIAVQVNGRALGDFVNMVRDNGGHWFAPADLLEQARLVSPTARPITVSGSEYYPLEMYPGGRYHFDAGKQLLDISLSGASFLSTTFKASVRVPFAAMPSDPGLFLNHNFQVSGSGSTVQLSAEEEVGFFSRMGVLTSQFVGRKLSTDPAVTRLQTQFFRDLPQRMATLALGDNVSSGFANWAETVNYAGVRWASNFSSQPAFLAFSLPSVSGQAAQASTVDLYVDGLRTLQQPVYAGPFAISDIPVVGTEGNIQMVVTDMLGQQQRVSLPYISTLQLLRPGVNEFAYESGIERFSFGQKSNKYADWFGASTYRRGLTNSFTIGLRGEALLNNQTAGIGFDYGILRLGVVSGGVAASHDKAGQSAGLVYAQLQHSTRAFSISLYAQDAQPNFCQLGQQASQKPTQFLGQAQVSAALGKWVTVGSAYMHQEKPGVPISDALGNPLPRFNTVTPSMSVRLLHGATLMVSGNYTPEFKTRATGVVSLIIPLKKQRLVTSSTGYQAGGTTPLVEYSQAQPPGKGYGYKVRTSSSNNLQTPRVDASVSYQNDYGTYQLEGSLQRGQSANWLFDYTGGAVMMRGHALLSRQLSSSFAVVDTNGASGVRVMANNNYVATTDHRGLALVPALPAYNPNVLSLDDSSVPLNVDVDLASRTVVPMARSGLLVKFKAEAVKSALLFLVQEDGKEVPQAATVTVNGSSEELEVAMRGQVFVNEIQFPAHVLVHWDGGSCQATVAQPENNDPLPQIGPIPCRRMQ